MIAKSLRIEGIVQGVGYRAWMVRKATALGVAGWVRNRSDGSVEALVYGEAASVEELLRNCRVGPLAASVTLIREDLAQPEEESGFRARSTVP